MLKSKPQRCCAQYTQHVCRPHPCCPPRVVHADRPTTVAWAPWGLLVPIRHNTRCALHAPYYKYISTAQAGSLNDPTPVHSQTQHVDQNGAPSNPCIRNSAHGCRITMSQSDKKYPLTACSHTQTNGHEPMASVCLRYTMLGRNDTRIPSPGSSAQGVVNTGSVPYQLSSLT